jgi:hypothetical protein
MNTVLGDEMQTDCWIRKRQNLQLLLCAKRVMSNHFC